MLSRFILQHDPCTDQRLTCSGLHNTACQIINWPLCFVEKNALLRRTDPSLLKTSYHLLHYRKLQPKSGDIKPLDELRNRYHMVFFDDVTCFMCELDLNDLALLLRAEASGQSH